MKNLFNLKTKTVNNNTTNTTTTEGQKSSQVSFPQLPFSR